jgi:hypothetical protein
MFSKTDTTYKSQTGGYRKYVYAGIAATAAMLGGAALFGDFNTTQDLDADLTTNLVSFL